MTAVPASDNRYDRRNRFHSGLQKRQGKILANNYAVTLASLFHRPNVCVLDYQFNSVRHYLSTIHPRRLLIPERNATTYAEMCASRAGVTQRYLDRHEPADIQLVSGTFREYMAQLSTHSTTNTQGKPGKPLTLYQFVWLDCMGTFATVQHDIDAAFQHPRFLDPRHCIVGVTVQAARLPGGHAVWNAKLLAHVQQVAQAKGYTTCRIVASTGMYGRAMLTVFWECIRAEETD
jgi:hypothetical protein